MKLWAGAVILGASYAAILVYGFAHDVRRWLDENRWLDEKGWRRDERRATRTLKASQRVPIDATLWPVSMPPLPASFYSLAAVDYEAAAMRARALLDELADEGSRVSREDVEWLAESGLKW